MESSQSAINHQDTIPTYCYVTQSRKSDVQRLVESLKTWNLTKGWRLLVAASSVQLINARRTKTLKIDVYRTVYADVLDKGACQSKKIACKNLEHSIQVAKDIFDNEYQVQRKAEAEKGTPKEDASGRGCAVSEDSGQPEKSPWWVCV